MTKKDLELQKLRDDEEKTSQELRKILPAPADYDFVLQQLATSIGYAEEFAANGWSVTLKPRLTDLDDEIKLFRLNMGQVEVLTIDFHAKIRVLMTEPSLLVQDDLRPNLTKRLYKVADPKNYLWIFKGSIMEFALNREKVLGARLRLPNDTASHPSTRSLNKHLEEFKEKFDRRSFQATNSA